MEPLIVIANAEAGSDEQEHLDAALRVLRASTDVDLCTTSNPGELDGALHRAGSRPVVVAGGDGSLHAVVAALYRRHDLGERTLGLLPFGTGNDFARTLSIPLDPHGAARVLLEGRRRRMDLLVDELGEIVVNSVHTGASAMASRRADRWKGRLSTVGLGLLGYPIGAISASLRPPFVRLRIELDGETVADMDQHVLMVALGNGASVGGGTEVVPAADPEDGRVDVMVSFATGPLARFGYVAALVRGDHTRRGDVSHHRAREVSISGEEFYISADGEVNGPERRRTWHVEHAAYTLIVP